MQGTFDDDDGIMAEFCGCIDCPKFLTEELNDVICGSCTGSVEESTAVDYVCAIDADEDINDDELVTADYWGLRDVDRWQRRENQG